MRRLPLLIVTASTLLAGCEGAGPVDPGITPSGIAPRLQNDSIPPAPPSASPEERASGGILIGSGT